MVYGKARAGSPFHEGARNPITSPSGAQMWAHVLSFPNGPRISAAAYHGDTVATVIEGDADNAAELANVLDVLAAASPQDIRAFAAQVREASAKHSRAGGSVMTRGTAGTPTSPRSRQRTRRSGDAAESGGRDA